MFLSQVTEHLQKIHFTTQFGDYVSFDKNGDPPAYYEIINWQLMNEQMQHATVGHFAYFFNGEYELSIKEEDIIWKTGKTVNSFNILFLLKLFSSFSY